MVDQPEYGTNTSYLVDFIKITTNPKLLEPQEIRDLYLNKGLSAGQLASHFGVSKSFVLARLHSMGIREGLNAGRSTNPENYRCHVAPYGYQVRDGKLVTNKAELRICRLVVELMARQGLSAYLTARELERRGIKNRAGGKTWDRKTLNRIYERWKEKL